MALVFGATRSAGSGTLVKSSFFSAIPPGDEQANNSSNGATINLALMRRPSAAEQG